MVLGLDCADPYLIFEQFKSELPVLSALARQGVYGRLESSTPCITVPAWSSMLSSRDPGVLGIYGFRNRVDHSYSQMQTADSRAVKVKRVWDYASEAGLESVIMGVPQTYPVKPLKGHLVSCFLTPGTDQTFTYPAVFKQEVLQITPDYPFDIRNFRTEDKSHLLQQIIDFTEIQFKLLKATLTTKPWDFLMHVNMGIDRIHHGFWRYHDPLHRFYEPGNPFQTAIVDYYRMVDSMIGQLIELAGDDTTVLIVSDHGVKRMDGGICINEWLWQNGWLTFHTPPVPGKITPFDEQNVDWAKTRAWASGGYYGRVFLNVEGREPAGIIPPTQYQSVRDELAAQISAIPGADGQSLRTTVYQPEAIYSAVNGVAPDLLVYFGDLHWRSVGSLGHGQHFTLENDTGPDDANHAQHGMYILYEPGKSSRGQVDSYQLMDIAPTLLNRLALKVPQDMQGRIIHA